MPFFSTLAAGITAAAASVSASVASFFTVAGFTATVGKAVLSIGLSLGLSALSRGSQRKAASTAETVPTTQVEVGGDIPRQVAMGRVGTKGHLTHIWAHGIGANPKAFLTQIHVLSDGWIGGLVGVWIGDKKMTLVSLTPTHGEAARYATVEKASPFFEVRIFDGRPDQEGPSAYLGSVGMADLPETSRGAGVAYAVTTLLQANSYWQGSPDILYEIDGYRCYDPRKDGTAGGSGSHRWDNPATWEVSENPAVQIYNYLRGIRVEGQSFMGLDVPDYDLDTDSFIAAANICDEAVTLDAGGTEPRYRSSVVLSAEETDHRSALAPIVQAMAGFLVERTGEFGVIPGAAQSSVATITDDDIIWPRGVRWSGSVSRLERVNEVHGQFIDEAAAWQANSYPAIKSATALSEDGERLAVQLDFRAVRSVTQAQRTARARLRETRRQKSATINVGYHLLRLEIGDWITWNSARYGSALYRITGWSRLGDDTTQLEIREVGNEIYSWSTADEQPFQPPAGGVTESPGIRVVSNFTVQEDVAPESGRPIAVATWDELEDERIKALIIEYRPVGSVLATRVRDDSPLDGRYVFDQPATGADYEYRSKLVTEPARQTDWTSWTGLRIETPPLAFLPDSISPDFFKNDWRIREAQQAVQQADAAIVAMLDTIVQANEAKRVQEVQNTKFRADIALGLNPIGSGIERVDQIESSLTAAFAAQIVTVNAAISGVAAMVETEESARVDGDSAAAEAIEDLTAQIGTDLASVQDSISVLAERNRLTAQTTRTLFVQDLQDADGALLAALQEAVERRNVDSDLLRKFQVAGASIQETRQAIIEEGEARALAQLSLSAEVEAGFAEADDKIEVVANQNRRFAQTTRSLFVQDFNGTDDGLLATLGEVIERRGGDSELLKRFERNGAFIEEVRKVTVANGEALSLAQITLAAEIAGVAADAMQALSAFAGPHASLAAFQTALASVFVSPAEAGSIAETKANQRLSTFAGEFETLGAFKTNLDSIFRTGDQVDTAAEAAASNALETFAGEFESLAQFKTNLESTFKNEDQVKTLAEAEADSVLSTFAGEFGSLAEFKTDLESVFQTEDQVKTLAEAEADTLLSTFAGEFDSLANFKTNLESTFRTGDQVNTAATARATEVLATYTGPGGAFAEYQASIAARFGETTASGGVRFVSSADGLGGNTKATLEVKSNNVGSYAFAGITAYAGVNGLGQSYSFIGLDANRIVLSDTSRALSIPLTLVDNPDAPGTTALYIPALIAGTSNIQTTAISERWNQFSATPVTRTVSVGSPVTVNVFTQSITGSADNQDLTISGSITFRSNNSASGSAAGLLFFLQLIETIGGVETEIESLTFDASPFYNNDVSLKRSRSTVIDNGVTATYTLRIRATSSATSLDVIYKNCRFFVRRNKR